MREALHRFDDAGHAVDALDRALDGARHALAQVVDISLGEQRIEALAGQRAVAHGAAAVDNLVQRLERLMDEMQVVADELHRRVDLVGDAGGKLAERLQLLRLAQIHFQLALLAQIDGDDENRQRLAFLVALARRRQQHRNAVAIAQLPVVFSAIQRIVRAQAAFDEGRRRRPEARQRTVDAAAGLDAEQAVELAIGAGDLAARRQGQQGTGNHFVQAEQIAVDGTHLPLVHQQLGIAFANLLLERGDPRIRSDRGSRCQTSAAVDRCRAHGYPSTRWMVAISCSGLNGLTSQPVAPAALPSAFFSGVDSVVSISSGVNL